MSDLWAVSARANLLDTDDLRESVENPEVVADGEVAVCFDTGSEDGALIYASSWAELAGDLERVAARIRRNYPEERSARHP